MGGKYSMVRYESTIYISTLKGFTIIAQKIKFSIKNFFSQCDQIYWKLRIWSHLLKKRLVENFIFCTGISLWHLQHLTKILQDDSVDGLIATGSHFESCPNNLNIFICGLLLMMNDIF